MFITNKRTFLKGDDKMLKSKVKEFLENTGMSKSKFSIKAGVHGTCFNSWLNSDYELSSDNLKRVEICLYEEQRKLREYLNRK